MTAEQKAFRDAVDLGPGSLRFFQDFLRGPAAPSDVTAAARAFAEDLDWSTGMEDYPAESFAEYRSRAVECMTDELVRLNKALPNLQLVPPTE